MHVTLFEDTLKNAKVRNRPKRGTKTHNLGASFFDQFFNQNHAFKNIFPYFGCTHLPYLRSCQRTSFAYIQSCTYAKLNPEQPASSPQLRSNSLHSTAKSKQPVDHKQQSTASSQTYIASSSPIPARSQRVNIPQLTVQSLHPTRPLESETLTNSNQKKEDAQYLRPIIFVNRLGLKSGFTAAFGDGFAAAFFF